MGDLREYEDIIKLPHHIAEKRIKMPVSGRAAQFAPFAALTGYGEAIKETARLTEPRIELEEAEKKEISDKLQKLRRGGFGGMEVKITYFIPDERKNGGSYALYTGKIRKIKEYERLVVTERGENIPIDEILHIDGADFEEMM